MRYAILNFMVALVVFSGSALMASAEGKFLEGCFDVRENKKHFRKMTIEWVSNRRAETNIVHATINFNGKAAVCGLYMNEGPVPQSDLKLVLSRGEIKVGQQTMIRNLSYFKNACNGGGCILCAPCFMTSLDWKSAYSRAKLSLSSTENFEVK